MRRAPTMLFTIGIFLSAALAPAADEDRTLSLAGEWRFRLDPAGAIEGPEGLECTDSVRLPGTTDRAGFGESTEGPEFGHLTRKWRYVGPAWYQRDVVIPGTWEGREVALLLERCLWESRVWLDGRFVGRCDSLCTPHQYTLATVAPGTHTVTLRVDNGLIVNIGEMGHSYTEETQSIWNGVAGRIELSARDPVRIDFVKTYPDGTGGRVKIALSLQNHTGVAQSGIVETRVREIDGGRVIAEASVPFTLQRTAASFGVELSVDPPASTWDLHHPVLYEAEAVLKCRNGGAAYLDRQVASFGFRELGHDMDRVALNGRPVYLRGTLECCIFPHTGHPPMEAGPWERIFAIIKNHGLNHMRFHSWCPPEAAFDAADRAGVLLHVETPLWIDSWMGERPPHPEPFGRDAACGAFIQAELDRILDAYGNHPSFGMLCIGNEIAGDYALLERMIMDAKGKDPRRLYACSTARRLMPTDDLYVTHRTERGAVRGILGPGTAWDFSGSLEGVEVPVISHEIGQWVSYPDFGQVGKYTGALEARSLQAFRDVLAARGMARQEEAFLSASGAFALLLYKEEIEAALRTPGFGGFQLLDLHDFPGQGEALVGLLDAFWDSKGIATPEAFRRFCGDTVPLLRMPRFVWTSDETFEAEALVAHHGPVPLNGVRCAWSIRDERGIPLALGRFDPKDLPAGALASLGKITLPLSQVRRAGRFKLTLDLMDHPAANDWNLWVFPEEADQPVPEGVEIHHVFDGGAKRALAGGRKVLLLAADPPPLGTLANRFLPVFWSFSMFAGQPGTLGILCDPDHPALEGFPTERHIDWQWREIVEGSLCFILDNAPHDYFPIVQAIDDFHRNHKLGAVFETRAGEGKLLVCGFDLEKNLDARPAARRLRRGLLEYMASSAFDPKAELGMPLLERLLRTPEPLPKAPGPVDDAGAVLSVRAAAGLKEKNMNLPWDPGKDAVAARAEGFGYTVSGDGTWMDEVGSAWHGGLLQVTIRCPPGFTGRLYIHFHDWNALGRRGVVRLEDSYYALGDHTGEGMLAVFDLTDEATQDGEVVLEARKTAGPNLMITRIIVEPRS